MRRGVNQPQTTNAARRRTRNENTNEPTNERTNEQNPSAPDTTNHPHAFFVATARTVATISTWRSHVYSSRTNNITPRLSSDVGAHIRTHIHTYTHDVPRTSTHPHSVKQRTNEGATATMTMTTTTTTTTTRRTPHRSPAVAGASQSCCLSTARVAPVFSL